MFERYTENARRAIFFARYEASQLGSPYIEGEHILLGIVREDKALVLRLLKSMAISEEFRQEIERRSTAREKIAVSVDLPLSHESRRVLDYAAQEAKSLKHEHISPGHLLLGLMREEKCFAAELLRARGVDLAAAREIVAKNKESVAHSSVAAETVTLPDFGTDLVRQAREGDLPSLVGRRDDLDRLMRVLYRRTRANAVLVGEPGVGKKSIVHGLAHRMAEEDVPAVSLIALDLDVIASRSSSRNRLEENIETIIVGLSQSDMIFFIDGLKTFAQTFIANLMKPALQNGIIRCIAIATPSEYTQTVAAMPWLGELFTPVTVSPAEEPEALAVLRAIKQQFESFHRVSYTDEALQAAIFHSNSYFPGCFLPDKAIDLMDEAGAYVQLGRGKLPVEVAEAEKRLSRVKQHHENALQNDEFEKARYYADELKKQNEELKALRQKYNIDEKTVATVTRDDIEKIIAERAGISVDALRRSRIPKA